MFRTVLKVIYIGLSIFIGMTMYMGTYQSNGFQAILDRANGYIEEKNYDELARMLGGLVNKDEVITIDPATEENQILLYEGTTLSSYNTFKEVADKKDQYETIENIIFNDAYFLLVVNPSFENSNVSGDKVTNKSSVVFTTSESDKTYEYKLIQNSEVNKDFYKEFPKTLTEAVLSGSRDSISLEKAYGFYSIIFDKTIISTIEGELGGKIDGFYFTDNVGKEVANTRKDFEFTFESNFFTDMEPLSVEYTTYIDAYLKNKNGDLDKKKFEEVSKKFQSFTEEFDKKISENPTYAKGFEQKELITSAVTWKTIGQLSIYALIVIILYFLFFKFQQVSAICRNIYYKITGKKPKTAPIHTKNGKSTIMQAKTNIDREPIVKSLADSEETPEVKEETIDLDEKTPESANEASTEEAETKSALVEASEEDTELANEPSTEEEKTEIVENNDLESNTNDEEIKRK